MKKENKMRKCFKIRKEWEREDKEGKCRWSRDIEMDKERYREIRNFLKDEIRKEDKKREKKINESKNIR